VKYFMHRCLEIS